MIRCLALCVLFFVVNAIAEENSVKIQHNQMLYEYSREPRLGKFVELVNKQAGMYWAGARFYRTDVRSNETVSHLKQDILRDLKALEQYYVSEDEADLASTTAKVYSDLDKLNYAKRIILPLDPDKVRAKPSYNPRIESGSYLISVGGRSELINFIGLLKQKNLPFMEAADIQDYVEQLQYEFGASNSFIYMFVPDQTYQLVATGLWNSRAQAVPPSAYFYVPFESRLLPDEFKDINEMIAQLLDYKVVAQ